MKNREILLARHGLRNADLSPGAEGTYAGKWLFETLKLMNSKGFTLEDIQEKEFLPLLNEAARIVDGPGRETLIHPLESDLPLTMMDPHIRGIVRWLNELGIYTIYSCDGHGNVRAKIDLLRPLTISQINLLKAAVPSSMRLEINGKKLYFYYNTVEELFQVAENLYMLLEKPEYLMDLEANHFKTRLITLLNIPGASQNERRIRQFLQQKLRSLTDYMYTDQKGNLLAYQYCGDGPTILLSAHMDTVEEIVADRVIIEEGTILKSSEGILGADDRAGIAVILEILAKIHHTNFNGTIKVAFTIEEEIGCRGARDIDPEFLEDVDGAIVIDRRGTRDIVTSYANVFSFCNEEYGQLFEQAGRMAGMNDWRMTPGGLSDAKIFAEFGIPSVNLSAGYSFEHTDSETVNYKATYETCKLVEAVLHNRLIPQKNQLIAAK
jgi:tripeptide aminopeptidase